MRIVFTALTVLTVLAGFVLFVAFFYAQSLLIKPLALGQDTVILEVPAGQSYNGLIDKLEINTYLAPRAALALKIYGKISPDRTLIKAGEYKLRSGMSALHVLDKLGEGDVYIRSFTVPEGQTSWQIVQQLNAIEPLSGTIETIPPEGSLLPETYHYARGDDRAAKIKRMQEAMQKTLDTAWNEHAKNLPIKTKEEALILASIIEKETGVAGERKKVAGVFTNRLNIGMALQTDPTVIYALTLGVIEDEGKGPLGRRLLRKDLQIDSPYNTYRYPGLPPGPIANPGRASIEAALNPAEHDYLYFVADGTGGHAFGKTLADHNANVAKWRKIRKAQ